MTQHTCKGCGTPLVDGGIDWYCPKTDCRYDIIQAVTRLRKQAERKEREELTRLKAKYEEVKQ